MAEHGILKNTRQYVYWDPTSDNPFEVFRSEDDYFDEMEAHAVSDPVETIPPTDAFFIDLKTHVGASISRDTVDSAVMVAGGSIIEYVPGTGWPAMIAPAPPVDTDLDGMPDAWEDKNMLNKHDPKDGGLDPNDEGYSNLEVYLNELTNTHP